MKANCSMGKCSGDDQPIYIEFIDEASRARIKVEIQPIDFANMMTGLHNVPCEMTIRGKENIGLVMMHKTIEFEVSDTLRDRKEEAADELLMLLTFEKEHWGWSSTERFDSKRSFFERDGKRFARAVIRRWVEPAEGGE